MIESDIKEYLIEEKHCVDVWGAAQILGKAVGTIRNMTKMKNFPPHVKIGKKLYFEKDLIEEYKKGRVVLEIGKSA